MSMFTVHKTASNGTAKKNERVMPPAVTVRHLEPLVLPKQYPLKEVQLVHQQLIDKMKDNSVDTDREKMKAAARSIINDSRLQYTSQESDEFAEQVVDEVIGHGPIEPLIREERITDININGPKEIFCEVDGINRKVPFEFRDDEHLKHHINRIVSAVGRRVDESSPIVNARLKDGSRFNAILPPCSIKGPAVSIRKFTRRIRGKELLESQSISPWMLEFLEAAVKARLNIVISGGTGAGKTTLLNTVAEAIPNTERIITIEDSAEMQINIPNLVPLETRPENLEGEGEITQRQLLINALRMKPDRIVIGECRDGEAFDMLQAMNTGHAGSLTTVHANNPREALSRLQNMVLMAKVGLSSEAIREQIASAIHVIVQVVRMSDGSRRVTGIAEVTGIQENRILMQDIFVFQQKAVENDGRVRGVFVGNGIVPECIKYIELSGKRFEPNFFTQRMEV
jgi:pilus assembly protein CpaF